MTAAAVTAGFLAAIYFGHAFFRASRALEESRARTSEEAQIRVRAAPLVRQAGVFEPIASPATFRDAAVFRGSVYLCGPAGLLELAADGSVRARYAAGVDLPGPLSAVAAGVADPNLYIATSGEGLLMFDGRAFRHVRAEAAPYRKLTAVLPLATGQVLLGTEAKGVLAWDGQELKQFHTALAGFYVTALAGDDSSLWVGTIDRGVLHFRAGELHSFGEGEGLPDARVLSLAAGPDGTVYVGTALGIAEFRDGRFTRRIADGFFARSLLVHGGSLWAGTLEESVFTLPLEARSPRPGSDSAARGIPGRIERLLAVEGSVYALSGDGLYALAAHGGWRRFGESGSAVLADGNISALSFDGAGRLWAGYFDRGLDLIEPGLDRAAHVEDDRVFCVNRIVHAGDRGMTAVATANGLALFDAAGKLRQVLGRADGLIANQVTDVVFAPRGMVVATPAGLSFLDDSGVRSLYAFHGLVNNHAYTLASWSGRLLVGTLGGLSVLEGDVVRANFTTANSTLPHNWITAVASTGEDAFVGTYGAGVLRFDSSGRWHKFPDLGRFEVNSNAMLATERALYAGSIDAGLYVYNRSSGRWSNVRAGLPSANVTALAARGGYLYIGTDNGLVRAPEGGLAP